uniref:Uncharacterized protein n=1 Tax=Octopus bimaculoides TaxID=37653 RepID=A0A0L8I4F1_OCTBM
MNAMFMPFPKGNRVKWVCGSVIGKSSKSGWRTFRSLWPQCVIKLTVFHCAWMYIYMKSGILCGEGNEVEN